MGMCSNCGVVSEQVRMTGVLTSLCPACIRQKKGFKKQQKMMDRGQNCGGSGNNSNNSSDLYSPFMFVIMLPFRFFYFVITQIVNAYSKLFGAIYSEHLAMKSGEKNKAEGYTKIAFMVFGVLILTTIIISGVMHNKK